MRTRDRIDNTVGMIHMCFSTSCGQNCISALEYFSHTELRVGPHPGPVLIAVPMEGYPKPEAIAPSFIFPTSLSCHIPQEDVLFLTGLCVDRTLPEAQQHSLHLSLLHRTACHHEKKVTLHPKHIVAPQATTRPL
ncbi:unnamed protein product [Leuciscus chuanchicus]